MGDLKLCYSLPVPNAVFSQLLTIQSIFCSLVYSRAYKGRKAKMQSAVIY